MDDHELLSPTEILPEHIEVELSKAVVVSYQGERDELSGEFHGHGVATLDNNARYEGSFHQGKFHGKGKFLWTNGMAYEGDFAHNAMTGSGVYHYPDGSVYTGQVLDGLRHGAGKLVNSLQQSYDGEWRHGKRCGVGRMVYDEEQSVIYHGDWVDNLREGYAVMTYASNNNYEGYWKNDMKNGFGVMIWKDLDEVYCGHWLDDKPHGLGEHIWGETTAKTIKKQYCNLFRGEFAQGQRSGRGTFFYTNGSRYSGFWAQDVKQGAGSFLYPDGRIVAGDYDLNRLMVLEPEPTINATTPPANNVVSAKPTTANFTQTGSIKTVSSVGTQQSSYKSTTSTGPVPSQRQSSQAAVGEENVSPQFYLNILDAVALYPMPVCERKRLAQASPSLSPFEALRVSHRQTVKEIERILLKYNQFIKLVYKKYNEASNRQRQRQRESTMFSAFPSFAQLPQPILMPSLASNRPPPTPLTAPASPKTPKSLSMAFAPTESTFASEESRWERVSLATQKARNIYKRFYCCTLEQMLRFLRDCGVIGSYLNAFDFVKIVRSMRLEHVRVANEHYRSFVNEYFAKQPFVLAKEETEETTPNAEELTEQESEEQQEKRKALEEEKAQQREKERPIAERNAKKKIVAAADISLGALLDDFEQELFLLSDLRAKGQLTLQDEEYFHYHFDHAYWQQPVLEHEFIELFVRSVCESYSRRGVDENYLTLDKVVEKILAQKVLPLAKDQDPTVVQPVLRDLYSDRLQDYLRANRPLLLSTIWKQLRDGSKKREEMYTTLQPPSEIAERLVPWGGYCRVGDLVDWFYDRREQLLAENVTKEEIIETFFPIPVVTQTHINKTAKDHTAKDRRMNFDDFIDYSLRLMSSFYWQTDLDGKEVELDALPQNSMSTLSSGDVSALELQKRMESMINLACS